MPRAAHTRVRLAAVVILLLASVLDSSPSRANGDTTASIYWVNESSERTVQPMDPMTLADTGHPLSFASGSVTDSAFWLSEDGSTALVGHFLIDSSKWSLKLRVIDTVTGTERVTFPIDDRDAYVVALSRDGSRVVVSTTSFDKRARVSEAHWTVYDTSSGEPVSRFSMVPPNGQWFTAHVDGGARHMWLQSSNIVYPSVSTSPEIGSLLLQHIDLAAGKEVGRLTLGSVEVGTIARERADQIPVFESVHPAIALAPDGTTLAVVEPATEEVILLDGLAMTRIDTFAVREPDSLARRVFGWTGLLPTSAAAKLQVGEWRSVTFSADGESLYLTGGRGEITGETYEDYEAEWLGIRRVDLATGEVTATALNGKQVDRIIPVTSGDLYVLGPEVPWTEITTSQSAMVVQRLDGQSLAVEATRTLGSNVWQVIVAQL